MYVHYFNMNMHYVQIHYTVVAFTVCGEMPKVIAMFVRYNLKGNSLELRHNYETDMTCGHDE